MDLSWLGVAVAPVGALGGVALGSRLTQRGETRRWLREQRLEAYVELLDLLTATNRHFAVGMRVNKFRADDAPGHDFHGAEIHWMESLDALQHLELKLSLLGERVSRVYDDEAEDLIADYFDAVDNVDITEEEWDALVARGHRVIRALARAARVELGVPVPRAPN